ncbi:hypothetical protein RZS08_41095, partial [Arthrospira platensis SPKY1]|nr:hypothetical protein [Arthrospira platensis SPKY1]
AGQHALNGLDKVNPALAQSRDIGNGCRMLPHLAVHGRSNHYRCQRSKVQRGQQIGGQTMRKLSYAMRGGRRNQQQISLVRQLDMSRIPAISLGPQIVTDRIPRQRLQGHRRDEFGSGAG